jgi:hypothetical protein
VNTWQIIGLVVAGWFVLSVLALILAMKCFEAGRYAERKMVSENLAEIVRQGVDKVLGAPNEQWSKPMRDQLRLKMFETISEVKNTTRH